MNYRPVSARRFRLLHFYTYPIPHRLKRVTFLYIESSRVHTPDASSASCYTAPHMPLTCLVSIATILKLQTLYSKTMLQSMTIFSSSNTIVFLKDRAIFFKSVPHTSCHSEVSISCRDNHQVPTKKSPTSSICVTLIPVLKTTTTQIR